MIRRDLLKALGLAALAGAALSGRSAHAAVPAKPFVLVHGAWHGGWCWRHVRARLIAAGHEVYTPTLTGQGERHHLTGPDITLDTHIDDVARVIEWEELDGVVLVGHSYGGYVVTGVADRLRGRLARVVYLDALIPTDGRAVSDASTPEQVAAARATLIDGYRLPSPPPLPGPEPAAARARAQGWDYHELATGHDAMVTAPAALADLLLARA